MQAIQTTVNKAKSHLLNGQEITSTTGINQPQPIDKQRIGIFWAQMVELFAYKWSSTYGEKPSSKSLWVRLLSSLTDEEITRGLNLLFEQGNEWPPTPMEFKNLCCGVSLKKLGLPELDIAFNRALSGMYRNSIIEAAAKETGVFDLQRGVTTDLQLKKRFEYNYFEMARRWANGESLTKPVTKAIEHTQEMASVGVCDDLVKQGIQTQRASGKSGYEAFLEAKRNLRGRA